MVYHVGPQEQTSVKLESKYRNQHSRKFTWNCRGHKFGHCVQASLQVYSTLPHILTHNKRINSQGMSLLRPLLGLIWWYPPFYQALPNSWRSGTRRWSLPSLAMCDLQINCKEYIARCQENSIGNGSHCDSSNRQENKGVRNLLCICLSVLRKGSKAYIRL